MVKIQRSYSLYSDRTVAVSRAGSARVIGGHRIIPHYMALLSRIVVGVTYSVSEAAKTVVGPSRETRYSFGHCFVIGFS